MAIAKNVTINLGAEKYAYADLDDEMVEGVNTYDINIQVSTKTDETSGVTLINGIVIKLNPQVVSIDNADIDFDPGTGVITIKEGEGGGGSE